MGDGRAEGLSAIGEGGQAAISLTTDVDGMQVRTFESSQLEGSYVGDLLYYKIMAVFPVPYNYPCCLPILYIGVCNS